MQTMENANEQKMVSKLSQSVLVNIAPLMFSGVAFSLGLLALITSDWIILTTGKIGLFQTCYSTNSLSEYTINAPWKVAVIFFMISLLICLFSGIVLIIVSFNTDKDYLETAAAIMFLIAGVFGLIAMSAFSGTASASTTSYSYGTSAIFGWVSVPFSLLSALFAFLAHTVVETRPESN